MLQFSTEIVLGPIPDRNFILKQYVPNPFNNEIHIQIEGKNIYNKATVTITDITGKKLFNNEYGKEREIVIHNQNLAPGSYFIQVKLDEFVITKHLIRTE